MQKQELQKWSINELQQYEQSLIKRNQQLKNMMYVCLRQGDYLSQRIDSLKFTQKNFMINEQNKNFQANNKMQNQQKTPNRLKKSVTNYAQPVLDKIKQSTTTIGKNIIQQSTKIGSSIWSFGTSLKYKLLGQSSNPSIQNNIPINQLTLSHQPATTFARYQQQMSEQHPTPNIKNTSQYYNVQENNQQQKQQVYDHSQKLSSKESKSIIDKLDAVISGQI